MTKDAGFLNTSSKEMNQDNQNKLAVILFAISCIILYFNSLWGIFLFDDIHTIPRNLFIKDIRYIPLFFKGHYTSEPLIPQGMFRPLFMITFVFNYAFSGLKPFGYHIVNIVFHFLNVVLFYCFLKALKQDLPFGLALLASLLFLSHPINTEAVTYISARSDLMACFFVLLAFICYVKGRFYHTVILYTLGLLSKETVLVLPFLILAYDFLKASELKSRKYIVYITVLAITVIYWVYRQSLYGPAQAVLSDLYKSIRSPYSNILTQLAVNIFYLRLFVFPHPLTPHHNIRSIESFFHPFALFSLLALIVMLALILLLRKKKFLFSLGLAWYLICLLPKFYSPLNVVAAEHHFYMPSLGVYLILAVLLEGIYLRFQRKFTIIAIGIICIFGSLVLFKNYEYSDDYIFWKKALEADPTSFVPHHNLGMVYNRNGFYEKAEEQFKKVLSMAHPSLKMVRSNALDNLANTYRLQKKYKEAVATFNKIIELKINSYVTYQNFGVVYLDMGDEEKAMEMWKKGLALNPQASGILLNIGLHYLKKLEFSKAKPYFEGAVRYDPDAAVAQFGLGRILQEEGKIDPAIKAFVKSIELQPDYAISHYQLALLYTEKADPRAFIELQEAVRLAPNLAEAHNNLAVIYAGIQPPQLDKAREHAQKALDFGYKVDKKFLEIINLPQEENP